MSRKSLFLVNLFGSKRIFFLTLKRITGFFPGELAFYELAFIHKSASKTTNGHFVNNERLEYLGDAILDAVVADFVFTSFPHKDEGFLTQMRSKLVKRAFLDDLAMQLGIHRLVISQIPSFNNKKHLYGNALEALVGAIYLDKGYALTKKFVINKVIKKYVDLQELIQTETDFKSRIIEWGQKNKQEIYFDNQEEIFDLKKNPIFISRVKVVDKNIGTGKGFSKKEAEQNAAEQALLAVGIM